VELPAVTSENKNKKIIEIGRVNGYQADQIQRIIKKQDEITFRRNLMTLSLLELKKGKRISYPFYPDITNKISNVFKCNDIQMVCSEFKLKKKLGSPNDKI
jgi:hypothetical protein